MTMAHAMELLLSDQNPLLPSVAAMQVYSMAAWSFLEWCCAVWLMQKLLPRLDGQRKAWICAVLLVALLYFNLARDAASPAYWLGLAFNAPAFMTLLLCGLVWDRPDAGTPALSWSAKRWRRVAVAAGVVLGYVLLLDLLALLPLQVYAWGFSPVALLVLAAVSLLPCIALNPLQRGNRWTLFLPLSLLLFALTRLPTGNVWDVVLDPVLWVALQVGLVIRLRRQS